MKTKFASALGLARHSFGIALCLGAVILICSSASAQNLAQILFRSDGLRGSWYNPGNIYELTPCGATGCVVQRPFASGLNGPEGLAFDRAGNLFVTDEGSGNIYEFKPTGVRGTFASGLSGLRGLAFDSAGNLYVACFGSGNIYKFTPHGVRTTFASGLSYPYALAFDSAGNLFVTVWGSSSSSGGYVYKYTWDGLRSTFAELRTPLGLAFDSAGNLLVADEDSGNIYKFTPRGVRTTFADGVIGTRETGFLAFSQ